MSLQNWCNNGWLRAYRTSKSQIAELFAIADRDLEDARTERLSTDWQFGIAYNAALKLCTILLYAEGYRPERNLAHYRTLQSLSLILGTERQGDAEKPFGIGLRKNTQNSFDTGVDIEAS
jgi:hypothetical protein